ncbi:MAG: MFS transporter [Deltaproteobacteria bacterium]|nr:MFS transporter [Deltaproteobacteria bacterium]
MQNREKAGLHLKRNTVGGVVGNILEWYDFAVFGYFAPVIGAQFFPSEDKFASMISAFGVFAAGYMMRPLGGIVFGTIGDRLGRKKALQLSVAMMALPTILLGFLPTYATVGVAASALLVLLRLVQGISVGGELVGSISFISEIAPANRRGLYGSWTLFSAIGGVMLGSLAATLIHAVLDDNTIHDWGWRIPFLAGFLVAGFGIWMRKGMVETPDFEQHREAGEVEKNPVVQALKNHLGKIMHVMALVVVLGGGFYMLFVWWPTYLTKIIPAPVPHALTVNTISMLALMIMIPLMGLLSDIRGRKTVLLVALGGLALFSYPLFVFSDHGTFAGALVCQLIFAVFLAGVQGPIPAVMVEMFPTMTRFSGIAMGYNISMAVFGGTAPLISTWIIQETGHNVASPAYYLIFMSLVSFAAAMFIHGKGKQGDLE